MTNVDPRTSLLFRQYQYWQRKHYSVVSAKQILSQQQQLQQQQPNNNNNT